MASVANVLLATSAEVTSAIPDLTPGSNTAKALATIQVTENFGGAIDAGGTKSIRVIAPDGVAFQDAASVANATVGTPTITATFNPNDTLIVQVASSTITLNAKAVIDTGLSGKLWFDVVDGDIDGNNGAGITDETVLAAYAGDLDALDGGDDTSVNIGFMVSNTATGGLAPYTASSSNEGVATVTVSGDSVMVEGVAAGAATITVKDDLMASATFDITVNQGATQSASVKPAKTTAGGTTDATFTAGASSDGGSTFGTEFTAGDDVTIVATANVDPDDQGKNGEILVIIQTVDADGNASFNYLDVNGDLPVWDGTIEGLGAAEVAEPLASVHNITIYSGPLAAGHIRIAVGYSTEDGDVIYTGKALEIDVTE
jgi:hypothetical protein